MNCAGHTGTSTPAADTRPRGVLADDHAIVTDGLRGLLEPEFAVVAVVANGTALIEAAHTLCPDFVIADIAMPLQNGIDAIREIKQKFPQIHAICLSMHTDRMYLAEALEAGAAGFVAKHAAAAELRHAIRAVLHGGSFISPLIGGHGALRGRPFATPAAARSLFKMTARQRQVLQLVAEGYTVREIAAMLGLAAKTVEFHKYRIIESLGLESSAAMIQFAVQHGMVSK